MTSKVLPLFELSVQTNYSGLNQYEYNRQLSYNIEEQWFLKIIKNFVLCLYYFARILHIRCIIQAFFIFKKTLTFIGVTFKRIITLTRTSNTASSTDYFSMSKYLPISVFFGSNSNKKQLSSRFWAKWSLINQFSGFYCPLMNFVSLKIWNEFVFFRTILFLMLKILGAFYLNYLVCRYLNYTNVYKSLFLVNKDIVEVMLVNIKPLLYTFCMQSLAYAKKLFKSINGSVGFKDTILKEFQKNKQASDGVIFASSEKSTLRPMSYFLPGESPIFHIPIFGSIGPTIVYIFKLSFSYIAYFLKVNWALLYFIIKDSLDLLGELGLAWLFIDKLAKPIDSLSYSPEERQTLSRANQKMKCLRRASFLVFLSWAFYYHYLHINTTANILGFVNYSKDIRPTII